MYRAVFYSARYLSFHCERVKSSNKAQQKKDKNPNVTCIVFCTCVKLKIGLKIILSCPYLHIFMWFVMLKCQEALQTCKEVLSCKGLACVTSVSCDSSLKVFNIIMITVLLWRNEIVTQFHSLMRYYLYFMGGKLGYRELKWPDAQGVCNRARNWNQKSSVSAVPCYLSHY